MITRIGKETILELAAKRIWGYGGESLIKVFDCLEYPHELLRKAFGTQAIYLFGGRNETLSVRQLKKERKLEK